MAVLRRRGRRQDQDDPADPAAGLDLHAVADTVRDTAQAALGERPALAHGPEPVLGYGPDAYRVQLATADPPWAGTLVVRTSEAEVLRREATWIRAAHAHGFPAPELVTGPTADEPDELLVFRQPPGDNLAATMVANLTSMPQLLTAFGQLHARLHALPIGGPNGAGAGAEADGHDDLAPLDELAGWAEPGPVLTAVERELAWLDVHRPAAATGPPVLCHSELIAVYVYLDGPDPETAVPVNWTRAGLGDPAYDVAATLTAFWSVPIYVDNAIQRRMVKMARDSLASTYQTAYTEAGTRPLDKDALRYWQTFHLAGLATDLARRLHGVNTPWERGTIIPQPDDALHEVRDRFWELADGKD